MSISRVPHGFVSTKNLGRTFTQSSHNTFSMGSSLGKGPISRKLLDTALFSPKPGKVVNYTFKHTEINPYTTGALLAGSAAMGYGAYRGIKHVRAHPESLTSARHAASRVGHSINHGVGKFYAEHSGATKALHSAVGGLAVFGPRSMPGVYTGLGANVAVATYGSTQARKYKAAKRRDARR